MPVTAPERVSPPSPGALRYGLLTAIEPETLPARARGGGVVYDPDFCATAAPYPVVCAGTPPTKTFDEGQASTEAAVFAVYAAQQCGTAGYTFAEFEDKARARLAAGEQGAVEHALWTGLDAVGGTALEIAGFNNSTPTVIPVASYDQTNIVDVVSRLEGEAYLAEGYGYEAYIHAPVRVAAHAASQRLVVDDGGLKRTPYGSIWIFGGGYPHTDDTGAAVADQAPLYVTGKTTVWRDAEITVPPAAQLVDTGTNQQFLIAERLYAVSFDCFLAQATFDYSGGS